jgi:hypothetical protein
MSKSNSATPWFLWPFWALWRLVTAILQLTGRILGVVLSLVLLVVGALLSVTIIGAILGAPLLIVGVLLLIRSLF